ncbi:MAG TPA: glycoside hydrolase family 30 beta sandwich domain-containing protein [Flavitalea sp.]|nr:glycoside hydrolase family 30 beta sandwich domain-containing protein [Flavitalea sp.]
MRNILSPLAVLLLLFFSRCSSPDNPAYVRAMNAASRAANKVDCWITKPDQTWLLKQQRPTYFDTVANSFPVINVDSGNVYQSIDGFGYTLTGASAMLINKLDPSPRKALLTELFGHGEKSIGVSYIRLSIGASDLNEEVFSYDDLPDGGEDLTMKNFSILPDRKNLLPVIREIIRINPNIKFMSSPWSAPAWMKTNNSTAGGSLKEKYMEAYALYLVRYIQKMKTEGVTIDAITVQNEPRNGGNNPSMLMTAEQQAEFIAQWLGPAFRDAGIETKIIIYDHNCDAPEYPLTILNDRKAKGFIDGTAFHLYGGEVEALSKVYNEHPDRNIYFTEQYTGSTSTFGGDLEWHMKNVIIGTTRNWSKTALEWNLASDPAFSLHTPGGCTTCKGALTIDGSNISRNVAYYIIAHASKFVIPGSLRIGSSVTNNIQNVAFRRPDGKKVLIVYNDSGKETDFNIRFGNRWTTAKLPLGAAATFVW